MNKQQLASKIWESANKMRSKIEANEYKDYILGFIFYKFLSEKEENYLKKNGWTQDALEDCLIEEDEAIVKYCQDNLGYFIAYDNLYSTWLKMGSSFDVSNVSTALSAFNRLLNSSLEGVTDKRQHQKRANNKKVFDKIFDTLEMGLSKLGDSSGSRTKAIRDLLHLINDIPMDGKQDYDVLGFIYEYLISNFAANAGKKAGEFYTPHEVSELMSEIVANHLKDRTEIQIYDPTSGSGSLLINIGKCVAKQMNDSNKIKYYAQELKENTYNLTRMNLVMRGILPDNIITRCGDTLERDWPLFDESDPSATYRLVRFDAVVSNPPYSQTWDPTNKQSDRRYAGFGVAPKTKADYAFLLHDLFHLKPDGIMTIVLPHGVLFRGGEEEKIRRKLIEKKHVDAIIGLPANIFFGTGIPTIIMVLRQRRENSDTLIIDASKGYVKVGKNNKLQASDIKKIVDTYVARIDIPKFSRVVSLDEIRANEYNLNIPRYVDSSEKSESWDIYASMYGGIPNKEIDDLKEYWDAFPNLKSQIFSNDGKPYSSLKSQEFAEIIKQSQDVKIFDNLFKSKFSNFDEFLNLELIENINNVAVAAEEQKISNEIFKRLETIPLVDKYRAYQLLDDNWGKIENDLEVIQREGFGACRQVDPNMVIKKSRGTEVEVQDGWVGHIIPFDIVQNTLLKEKFDVLNEKQTKIDEVASEYQEIAENLSDEDKEGNYFDKENNKFINKEVANCVKGLNRNNILADSIEEKLMKVHALISKQKALKKEFKTLSDELTELTKKTIENLTDEQIYSLLNEKWIKPIVTSLAQLPHAIVKNLAASINKLSEKYETTFLDVETQISDAEKELSAMLDDLVGDEFDMKGVEELKTLLGGAKNDKK